MPELGIDVEKFRYEVRGMRDLLFSAEENPFTQNITYNSKTVLKRFKRNEIVDNEDANVPISKAIELTQERQGLKEIGLDIGQLKTKQQGGFALIYTNPMFNYKDISSAAIKVLLLIIDKRLNFNIDSFSLSITDCCTHLGMTRPTAVEALLELVRHQLIYPRHAESWWINPSFIYNGNRNRIQSK